MFLNLQNTSGHSRLEMNYIIIASTYYSLTPVLWLSLLEKLDFREQFL